MSTRRILHVVPGLNQVGNGVSVAARLIAHHQDVAICAEIGEFLRLSRSKLREFDEIWVHSNWRPDVLLACWRVIRAGVKLVRMPHGNLDPVRLAYHGWKKSPWRLIELYLYRHSERVVVTCEAEAEWCRAWGVSAPLEVCDLKRFFNFEKRDPSPLSEIKGKRSYHVLYLGRNHPLKDVDLLIEAVHEVRGGAQTAQSLELRCISDHSGRELEDDWHWCDILVLPTRTENFGLVIAEAIERGKYVLTTDGAVAWIDYFNGNPKKGRIIQNYLNSDRVTRRALLVQELRILN